MLFLDIKSLDKYKYKSLNNSTRYNNFLQNTTINNESLKMSLLYLFTEIFSLKSELQIQFQV